METPTGIELIAAERQRQIELGYTSRRDDEMMFGELALAATCYLLYEVTAEFSWDRWPWDHEQFKPKNKASNLVRAAALIAAEIDRLQRAAKEERPMDTATPLEPIDDPDHLGNSPTYHTGKTCIEPGCIEPAGTGWSPFWCQRHNAERIRRISAGIEHGLAELERLRQRGIVKR